MEAAIVGGLIAGFFALLSVCLAYLLNKKGREIASRGKEIASIRRALAVVTPPGSSDLILVKHSYSFDIEVTDHVRL